MTLIMKTFYKLKRVCLFMVLGLFLIPAGMIGQRGYIAGDFHQHTTYTDGSYSFPHVMKKSNEFGLDWWANSEHGGGFTRNALLSGIDLNSTLYWDQMTPNPIIGTSSISGGHQNMWRWQSIMGYSFKNLLDARLLYPEKTIIQGYEMNVPGHEHGSVGIITGQFGKLPNVYSLAEFEYKFDASDADMIGGESLGWKKSTLKDHAKTLEAVTWLQNNFAGESWLIPAHPERKKLYTIAHFRDMNNAGPDVCFGFESMPGHQKDANRGGYTSSADGGGTYGGCGVYAAEVGGLWDAMLSEGRQFWLFASSDFHEETNDFYPGEYQKTYTYVKNQKDAGSIVEGLRSGNSYVVEGDLINMLEFNASGVHKATMGETTKFTNKIRISIILRDPETLNNNKQNPTLNHIDLIMGKITGVVSPSDANYNVPKAPETKVIARFDNVGGIKDANGISSIRWKKAGKGIIRIDYVVETDESCYFRLRGTNHSLSVTGETDANGNPLLDCPPNTPNTAEKAWNDLWFYSNPIFAISKNSNGKSTSAKQNGEAELLLLDQEQVLNKKNEITVYPNPVSQILSFNNLPENSPIDIYNNFGIRVMSVKANGTSVNVASLPNGIYFARINADDESSSIRFIKE
jgi:hypothetical protein